MKFSSGDYYVPATPTFSNKRTPDAHLKIGLKFPKGLFRIIVRARSASTRLFCSGPTLPATTHTDGIKRCATKGGRTSARTAPPDRSAAPEPGYIALPSGGSEQLNIVRAASKRLRTRCTAKMSLVLRSLDPRKTRFDRIAASQIHSASTGRFTASLRTTSRATDCPSGRNRGERGCRTGRKRFLAVN